MKPICFWYRRLLPVDRGESYRPHQGLSEGARFLRSLQKIVNLLKVPLDEFVSCFSLSGIDVFQKENSLLFLRRLQPKQRDI